MLLCLEGVCVGSTAPLSYIIYTNKNSTAINIQYTTEEEFNMKYITITLLILLTGCAQVNREQPTHEWSTTSARLENKFAYNNLKCTERASNVASYELCMKSIGYRLN